MCYAGIRRDPHANANPLRSIPLFRTASAVLGSTARDRMVGAVRCAEQFHESWAREYAKARAALGRANSVPAENRRGCQSEAIRRLNAVRKAMKANLRDTARAQAALDTFDRCPPLPAFENGGLHTLPRRPSAPAWPAIASAAPVASATA